LLRINSRYVDKKYRGFDLLTYFTETWFLAEAFEKAQADGIVPYDEAFDPTCIISDARREWKFPFWLSLDVQNEILALHKSGVTASDLVSHWVGVDAEENHRCIAWLEVTDTLMLVVQTGMRRQLFPADVTDVLWQISAFDIKRTLDAYMRGESGATRIGVFEQLLAQYKNAYRMCAFGGYTRYSRGERQDAAR